MGCQWLKISYVRVDRTSKKDNQKRAGKRLFTMSSIDPIVLKVCAAPPVLLFWLDGIRVSNLCRLLCCSSIFYTRRPCEHIPFCTIYLPRLASDTVSFSTVSHPYSQDVSRSFTWIDTVCTQAGVPRNASICSIVSPASCFLIYFIDVVKILMNKPRTSRLVGIYTKSHVLALRVTPATPSHAGVHVGVQMQCMHVLGCMVAHLARNLYILRKKI